MNTNDFRNRLDEDINLITEEELKGISDMELLSEYEKEKELQELYPLMRVEAPDYISSALEKAEKDRKERKFSKILKFALPVAAALVLMVAGGSVFHSQLFGKKDISATEGMEYPQKESIEYREEPPVAVGAEAEGESIPVPATEPREEAEAEPELYDVKAGKNSAFDTAGISFDVLEYLDEKEIDYTTENGEIRIEDPDQYDIEEILDKLEEEGIGYCIDESLLVIYCEVGNKEN